MGGSKPRRVRSGTTAIYPSRAVMSPKFRLHALAAGTLPVPGWATLFGSNTTDLRDLGFYVWIVTDGTTVGLVDTGLPLDAADAIDLDDANRALDPGSQFRDVRLLPDLLAGAGLSGADIDFVAITQTVTYHTGGLDAELLPRAHVYIAFAGVRELLLDPPGHPAPQFYFTARGWSSLRLLTLEGRLHLVRKDAEIVPGITFQATGGHHPGSAALRIQTDAGTIGLLETAFLNANLEQRQAIGIAEDVATCRSVIRRYLRECDDVIAIHEPSNAARFPPGSLRASSQRQTTR